MPSDHLCTDERPESLKALFEVYCGLDFLESLIQLGNELFYISPAQLIPVQHFLMGMVRQSIGSTADPHHERHEIAKIDQVNNLMVLRRE